MKNRRIVQLLHIFAVAVVINYGWELAQTPLYVGVDLPGAIWHCFIASLGDGFLVLFIFGAVAAFLRSLDWHMRPGLHSWLPMAAAGLGVGFAVEWWGLHIAKRWQYSELMPIIPWTEVGAVPILQMLVLPPAIFWMARRLRGSGRAPAHTPS